MTNLSAIFIEIAIWLEIPWIRCNFCCCCCCWFDPSSYSRHARWAPLEYIFYLLRNIFQTHRLKYAPHYTTFRWAHFSTCCRLFCPLYTHNQPSSSWSSSSSPSCCSCQFAQPCANWIFQVCPIYQRVTHTRERVQRNAERPHKWNEQKLNIFLTILAGKMLMVFNFITSVFIIICFILCPITTCSHLQTLSTYTMRSFCKWRSTKTQQNTQRGGEKRGRVKWPNNDICTLMIMTCTTLLRYCYTFICLHGQWPEEKRPRSLCSFGDLTSISLILSLKIITLYWSHKICQAIHVT